MWLKGWQCRPVVSYWIRWIAEKPWIMKLWEPWKKHSWFAADGSFWSLTFSLLPPWLGFQVKCQPYFDIWYTCFSFPACIVITLNHFKPSFKCVQDFCLWPWTCKGIASPISLSCVQNEVNVSMSAHLKKDGEQVNVTYLQNVYTYHCEHVSTLTVALSSKHWFTESAAWLCPFTLVLHSRCTRLCMSGHKIHSQLCFLGCQTR